MHKKTFKSDDYDKKHRSKRDEKTSKSSLVAAVKKLHSEQRGDPGVKKFKTWGGSPEVLIIDTECQLTYICSVIQTQFFR